MKIQLITLVVLLGLCVPLAAQEDEPRPPGEPPHQRQGTLTAANDPNVQRAKALLQQSVQALGGQAWLNIQDMREDGRSYRFHHGDPSGGGVQYWRFWKWPDKERDELTKQRDVIDIFNGDQGWEITYKGTHPMDPDDLKEYLRRKDYTLEQVLRRWINEPGTAIFYEGAGLANNRSVEQVTIMNAKNQAVTISIDSQSHLPIKTAFELRDPQTGDRDQEAVIYDNYHVMQGIATPLSLTWFHNGDMLRQRFRHAVEYNVGIPESKFEATATPAPVKRK